MKVVNQTSYLGEDVLELYEKIVGGRSWSSWRPEPDTLHVAYTKSSSKIRIVHKWDIKVVRLGIAPPEKFFGSPLQALATGAAEEDQILSVPVGKYVVDAVRRLWWSRNRDDFANEELRFRWEKTSVSRKRGADEARTIKVLEIEKRKERIETKLRSARGKVKTLEHKLASADEQLTKALTVPKTRRRRKKVYLYKMPVGKRGRPAGDMPCRHCGVLYEEHGPLCEGMTG